MVEHPDIHPPPDDQPDVDKFAALADAPVTALGLSNGDADALEQALDVKTVVCMALMVGCTALSERIPELGPSGRLKIQGDA
jgi:hypothetical protein